MDLKSIKAVVELMKSSDLSEFELEEEGLKLRICRGSNEAPVNVIHAPTAAHSAPAPTAAAAGSFASAPATETDVKGIELITSPMVGTFYTAPSPESPAFVSPGDKVGSDSVVCIIEAMKVMNEIQAEISGTIVELLVENGDAVEYGQPLFKVKTA